MGRVPVSALAQAFKDAKIPKQLYSTTMFRVELIRQEQDAAGQFPTSDDQYVVVPPLASNPLQAMPGEQGTSTDWNNYQQWAETNYITVMQPPFYEYKQGDVWYVPGTKNPNEVQVQIVAFDPSTFKGDPGTLSPEDRKDLRCLEEEAAAGRRRRPPGRCRSQQYSKTHNCRSSLILPVTLVVQAVEVAAVVAAVASPKTRIVHRQFRHFPHRAPSWEQYLLPVLSVPVKTAIRPALMPKPLPHQPPPRPLPPRLCRTVRLTPASRVTSSSGRMMTLCKPAKLIVTNCGM